MRRYLLLLAVSVSIGAAAQDMAQRHALIDSAYKAERYAEVVRLVDLQLKEAVGTAWEDSAHLYLYKYGRAHRKLKDANAGVEAAERIYARVKDRARPSSVLAALFDLSWTYYEVGRVKDCIRVDSTAVVVADGNSEISASQRGKARQYLAFDYNVTGDPRNVAKYALQALDIYSKADSIAPVQWAETYTSVGVAYWKMGQVQKAEEYYMRSLKALGTGTSEEVLERQVSTCGNLGIMWQNAGDYTRSKTYYHESLRYSDRVIDEAKDPATRDEAIVNRSRTYINLATVYNECGDEARARKLLDMAWKDRSKVLEADDPQLLAVQERIADLEVSTGDLDKAEQLMSAYLIACELNFGKKSEYSARALSKLGDIAMRKHESEKADSLFTRSIAAGRMKGDAGRNVDLAGTLKSRALLKEEVGNFQQAIADLLQARDILVRVKGAHHPGVAGCDVMLAQAAFLKGDMQAARDHAGSALDLLQDRVKAVNGSNAPLTFQEPHLLPDAIYWKVRAEREMASTGAARAGWSTDLDLAIRSLARNKSAIHEDASKLLLVAVQKNLLELALDVAYEGYAASRSDADLEHFINISEADRSILLKNRLNTFGGLRFSGVPDSVIARESELYAALDLDPEDRAMASDMDKRERAYSEFLVFLEKSYPAYFNMRYGEPHVTLAEIRKDLLTSDRELLGYTRTEAHLYTWVVSMTGASIIRTDANGIDEAVKAFNMAILSRTAEPYASAAYRLYQLVFEPVAPLLTTPELFIIPDGALHTVNFEALLTAPGTKHIGEHFLIHRHAISYLLSTVTALRFADIARHRGSGLLAIAPGFTDELKQDYIASMSDTTLLDRDFLHLVRQPFAERTARTLGSTLSARVMTGKAANERAFRAQASKFGILHLGTHAEMNATSPMYSRLALSKDGSEMDPDDDGYLHAYEIYELDLRAQLAVLTACGTGIGKDDVGEGVRSLGYAFAYSGCPSLVMSLWNIDEKVSAEIIASFYKDLADGIPKHLALRKAKLDFLAHAPDELALPYYWAGLVLVGDVQPVQLSKAYPVWVWLALGSVLLFALGGWKVWRAHRLSASAPEPLEQ